MWGEGYTVKVTGKIIGEDIEVTDLLAEVATVYDEDHPDYDYFKVWPLNDDEPQLTQELRDYGKLWFLRSESTVVAVDDENCDPV